MTLLLFLQIYTSGFLLMLGLNAFLAGLYGGKLTREDWYDALVWGLTVLTVLGTLVGGLLERNKPEEK